MSKIFYAASTASHLTAFHEPYINALRSEGHTVMTAASGDGVDFSLPLDKRMLSLKNLRAALSLRRIIKKEKFDLLILNTSLMAFWTRLALGKSRPRVVNVVHGYLFPEKPVGLKAKVRAAILLAAERMLKKRTDAILTMNAEDFRIANRYSLAESIANTLGMGIPRLEVANRRDEIRREHGCENKLVLLFVGELSKRKDQSFLIEALPKIKDRGIDVSLWLVGDGNELSALKKQAKRLGCEGDVIFFGSRRDARDIMAASDVYVSSSKSEGLPFNIVEALMAGCKVVASDVKGHRDVLADGAGALYAPTDEEAFVSLVLDKDSRLEDKALLAVDKFSLESVFDGTMASLREAGKI